MKDIKKTAIEALEYIHGLYVQLWKSIKEKLPKYGQKRKQNHLTQDSDNKAYCRVRHHIRLVIVNLKIQTNVRKERETT